MIKDELNCHAYFSNNNDLNENEISLLRKAIEEHYKNFPENKLY